jgi:ribonuclease HI
MLLRWDGGSAPTNPGPSAGSYVLYESGDLDTVAEGGVFLPWATNNQAEYSGLIAGLEKALELGVRSIRVEGDSMLAVKQVRGEWKVRSESIRPMYERAMALVRSFHTFEAAHIPRALNARADALSDETIKRKESWATV